MGRYFNRELFGERLLGLMSDNNDTTYSLAEYLHLSAATISRYTTGDIAPKITAVQAMAEKYGVNPAWLMGFEDVEKYVITEKIHQQPKRIPVLGRIAAAQNHQRLKIGFLVFCSST